MYSGCMKSRTHSQRLLSESKQPTRFYLEAPTTRPTSPRSLPLLRTSNILFPSTNHSAPVVKLAKRNERTKRRSEGSRRTNWILITSQTEEEVFDWPVVLMTLFYVSANHHFISNKFWVVVFVHDYETGQTFWNVSNLD